MVSCGIVVGIAIGGGDGTKGFTGVGGSRGILRDGDRDDVALWTGMLYARVRPPVGKEELGEVAKRRPGRAGRFSHFMASAVGSERVPPIEEEVRCWVAAAGNEELPGSAPFRSEVAHDGRHGLGALDSEL